MFGIIETVIKNNAPGKHLTFRGHFLLSMHPFRGVYLPII